MVEEHQEALRVDFDRSVKVEFHGANVTSDAVLPAFRELDETLGLTGLVAELIVDTRTGLNTNTPCWRSSGTVYSCLAASDTERLCRDPSMRKVVGQLSQGTQSSLHQ